MKQNTNSICLYIKISISPYFSISPLGALLGLQGPIVIAVESVARVRTSTQNTSMQKVKTNPYRYNFKIVGIQNENSTGDREQGLRKKKHKSVNIFNGAYKLALSVLTLLFLLSV